VIKDIRNGVRYYPDSREVCQDTAAGRREYKRRLDEAWHRQEATCGICKRTLVWAEATVDHIQPRGMGGARRDDRQENIQAVHAVCNSLKGSKRNYRAAAAQRRAGYGV
jgi:5-methylcytosine-specific restriction endonuclease McrA